MSRESSGADDGMFVCACPTSGRVHAYPREMQELLKSGLRDNKAAVVLGTACFDATVHLNCDGRHFQTTPARGHRSGGYRTVAWLPKTANVVPVYYARRRWALHTTELDSPRRDRMRPTIPTELNWEWSVHADWVPYTSDASDDLERAWRRVCATGTQECVTVRAGLSSKVVFLTLNSAFFEQRDTGSNNRRWARRSFQTHSQRETRRNMLTQAVAELSNDSCAICLERFAGTFLWPVVITSCGHCFHGCCICKCKTLSGNRCPLCRADML